MSNTYIPIACSLHDEYEIAIMHRKHLDIEWLDDDDELHAAKVLATDVLVKDKQEFLIADTQDGKALCIRLDKITLV